MKKRYYNKEHAFKIMEIFMDNCELSKKIKKKKTSNLTRSTLSFEQRMNLNQYIDTCYKLGKMELTQNKC